MSETLALGLALVGLAATLAVAATRSPSLSEAVVACVAAASLIALGAIGIDSARHAAGGLASTIGFLAALLLLADGCRREGLFDALGAIMARGSRGDPRRLLALVFVMASSVTVTLSLDPTIVLVTPLVFATAMRLRMGPKPYVYACSHLANSASLLLPISNLTNLLAFHASGLSFTHFAALMALPTAAAIAVEWVVMTRFFAAELDRPRDTVPAGAGAGAAGAGAAGAGAARAGAARAETAGAETAGAEAAALALPRFALVVLGATLIGFLLSSPLGIEPVFIALAGAAAITLPALARKTATPRALMHAAQPSFLVFVLGLGIIVAAASENGLSTAVHSVLPAGDSLLDLLCIAVVSAVLANLLNNLPAILILAPIAATDGSGAVLAALIGVNLGPNLTYVGSLATLLWRRILRAESTEVDLAEFLRLGAITVPLGLGACTLLLWLGMKVAI
jgi:arsenical pump membrane protein